MSKLLIVDDDDLALQLYELLLDELPEIDYVKAGDGTEALELFNNTSQEQWPDCVMVDVNMPDMSGFDLVTKLEEAYGKNALPPVYILSNSVSKRDKQTAAALSAIHGFISKPLTIESLQESLNPSDFT